MSRRSRPTTRAARATGRTPGRPSRVVEQHTRQALLDAFAQGASVEGACHLAGLAPATFYSWCNRAAAEIDRLSQLATIDKPRPEPRPSEWPFVEFLESVSRVRAQRQVKMLGIIDKVARGGILVSEREEHTAEGGYVVTRTYSQPDWRAAQWWLERAFPAQFGKSVERHAVEVSGPNGGPIEVTNSTAIASLAERLAQSFALQQADSPAEIEGAVDAEVVDEETAAS